jgi:uncharacterized protein YoxC
VAHLIIEYLITATVAGCLVYLNITAEKDRFLIMAKLNTLADTLTGIEATLNKVKTEVEALKASLDNVDIPANAQESLDRLTALSKALDDLNQDAPAA